MRAQIPDLDIQKTETGPQSTAPERTAGPKNFLFPAGFGGALFSQSPGFGAKKLPLRPGAAGTRPVNLPVNLTPALRSGICCVMGAPGAAMGAAASCVPPAQRKGRHLYGDNPQYEYNHVRGGM